MIFEIETTDTFGGEANYSWVRRYTAELPEGATDAQLKRAAKKEAGYTGHPGVWESIGEGFRFNPRGQCVALFVNYKERP